MALEHRCTVYLWRWSARTVAGYLGLVGTEGGGACTG